jgi:hypothetical protein
MKSDPHRRQVLDRLIALPPLPEADRRTVKRPIGWDRPTAKVKLTRVTERRIARWCGRVSA